MGNCCGGAGNQARGVHVRQGPEPGPDAGALAVVPEDLRTGPPILQAQGHYAQRALLGFGEKVSRGARGRRVLVAVQPRQLWVMNQQCGLVLELRDVKLEERVEEVCPL